MDYRIEKDTLGEVKVPKNVYWGAQTERSRKNFKIGSTSSMPIEVIYGFAYLKKSAAYTNHDLGVISVEKRDLISKVCDEIIEGIHDKEFPLVIWQTGSGTQSNMNINEVIANRAHVLLGKKLGKGSTFLSPNDDVNKSQSSNDTFPTAMHIAAYKKIIEVTIPGVSRLKESIDKKILEFKSIVKIGRTHLMDATPLTLGQEFSGYSSQLEHSINAIKNSLDHLSELAIGGTAVGTGINTPKGYTKKVVNYISKFTNIQFVSAKNKFEAIAAHDAIVETHGALKQLAVALNKIGNDIRLLASGPRSGIGEIILPANEPGSSIMPGKVNPTQAEALTMVCAKVIGNDVSISLGGMQGHYELNVYKPLMGSIIIESAGLLGDVCVSFSKKCLEGIKANKKRIEELVNNSLMLVTALTPHIGYDNAAKIAKSALKNNTTLKHETLKSGLINEKEYKKIVDPRKMIYPE